MRNVSTFIFLILFVFQALNSQSNLILNGSFGGTDTDCQPEKWSPGEYFGPPPCPGYENFAGYQLPRTGDSYAGILGWINGGSPNYFSIYTKLSSPLVPGVNYRFRVWLSVGDKTRWTNKSIGVKFSKGGPSWPGGMAFHLPAAFNKTTWEPFTYEFSVTDTFDFLNIGGGLCPLLGCGNEMSTGTGSISGYYLYLDDVSITKLVATDSVVEEGPKVDVRDGWIDLSEIRKPTDLVVTNAMGQTVLSANTNHDIRLYIGNHVRGLVILHLGNSPPVKYFIQ